ncbi:hypothetical protein HPP92_028979, partial [Vanilla planifolia]
APVQHDGGRGAQQCSCSKIDTGIVASRQPAKPSRQTIAAMPSNQIQRIRLQRFYRFYEEYSTAERNMVRRLIISMDCTQEA